MEDDSRPRLKQITKPNTSTKHAEHRHTVNHIELNSFVITHCRIIMTTLMRLTQFATTAKGKFADIQRSAHRTANLACECTEYVVRMSN